MSGGMGGLFANGVPLKPSDNKKKSFAAAGKSLSTFKYRYFVLLKNYFEARNFNLFILIVFNFQTTPQFPTISLPPHLQCREWVILNYRLIFLKIKNSGPKPSFNRGPMENNSSMGVVKSNKPSPPPPPSQMNKPQVFFFIIFYFLHRFLKVWPIFVRFLINQITFEVEHFSSELSFKLRIFET